MKKFLILLLLLLIPLNVFALNVDNEHYFNLTYPTNFSSDLTDTNNVGFGTGVSLKNFIDYLMTFENTYKDMSIFITYSASNGKFSNLQVYLHPKNTLNTYTPYGTLENNIMTYNSYFNFSNSSQRISFSNYLTGNSVLDSNMVAQIKNCMETTTCPTSKPTETNYNGTISFSSGTTSNKNTNMKINDFDSSLNYDLTFYNFLYFSNTSYVLDHLFDNNSYIYRNIKLENVSYNYDSIFDSYFDFYSNPDPDEPVEPDEPVDTNVGVWKNWVYWFVDNNTEYGVLVNIYILLFISLIFASFICFIKLIKKSRW